MLERLLKGCSLVRQCCVVTVLSLFFASRHSVDAFSAFQNEEPAFDYSTILYTRSDFDSRHRGLQENIFVEPPQNPCSLCSNSDTAQFPEKDVKHLLPPPSSELESFEDRISISQVTCAQTELFLGLVVSEDDKICIQARSLLAGVCGCPAVDPESYCSFCEDNSPLPDPFLGRFRSLRCPHRPSL